MTQPVRRENLASEGFGLLADVGGPDRAPTVFLFHGGGEARHRLSDAMAHLLVKGFHVINNDAHGHGEIEWFPPVTTAFQP